MGRGGDFGRFLLSNLNFETDTVGGSPYSSNFQVNRHLQPCRAIYCTQYYNIKKLDIMMKIGNDSYTSTTG